MATAATAVSSSPQPSPMPTPASARRGRVGIEAHPAAPELDGIQSAEYQVRVGHGGFQAALPVGNRPRGAARRLRTDPEIVVLAADEGPPARADRMDVDHGEADAVPVPPVPVGLDLGTAISDEADVIAGSPHVDTDHITEAGVGGRPSGRDHAARRAGAHGHQWPRTHLRGGGHPSRAGGQEQLPSEPRFGQRTLEPIQVSHDRRPHKGVDEGRRRPLELGRLREDLVGERDQLDSGIFIENDLPCTQLVIGIEIRVQEDDRDGSDAEGPKARRGLSDGLLVQGDVDLPFGRQSLPHLEPNPAAGDRGRRGQRRVPDVLLEATTQLDLVPESLGHQEAGRSS